MKATQAIIMILLTVSSAGARLSPLAPQPDWSRLEAFQETITRKDFLALLEKVYAPAGAWKETITVHEEMALISTRPDRQPFLLRFAPSRESAKPVPRYWRSRQQLPPEEPGKPLAGLRIALDPGHIGGDWARMEQRWFQIGDFPPVTEGDMTLTVAQLLTPRLEALGAEVFLTRDSAAPAISLGVDQLTSLAAESLGEKGILSDEESLRKESERLFYRVAEIRRRATLVNEIIRPDMVVCLHFNAEAWGDPNNPQLVDENHLHFL
ncbi:MAG TPA: N-acetylmuramoyl-L-alanine amidase, partial [Terrimicrobiaceae bacterium]|nr:N-acetylmuramoyl-L-alanine amidase [Terrimicrobiaceae bacterium]